MYADSQYTQHQQVTPRAGGLSVFQVRQVITAHDITYNVTNPSNGQIYTATQEPFAQVSVPDGAEFFRVSATREIYCSFQTREKTPARLSTTNTQWQSQTFINVPVPCANEFANINTTLQPISNNILIFPDSDLMFPAKGSDLLVFVSPYGQDTVSVAFYKRTQ